MTKHVLRPDQELMVRSVLQQASAGSRRILVYAATGAGKTTVFSVLAERAIAKASSCWVVVHREEIKDQAAARLRSRGLRVGVLMGTAESTDPGAEVQVVGVQTIAGRIRRGVGVGAAPKLVIVDEAHHCVSPTWNSVLGHCVGAGAFAVLFSATPWQANGTGLGVADSLVLGPSPSQLRDIGVLVEPTIYCGPTPDLTGLGTGSDFSQAALAERTNTIVADVVKTWKRHGQDARTICFAVNVSHSQRLVAEFMAAGVSAVHVDGETPDEERSAAFLALDSGDIKVVSNVGVVTEGFDCPAVGCVILARPTQSEGLYVQMVGRGLRASPGKTGVVILDHGYNALRHGHPMLDRPITLHGRPRRVKVPEDDLADNSTHFRICTACMKAIPPDSKTCPSCRAPMPERVVKEKRSIELVKFVELSKEQRDSVKILERRTAWFRMEATRKPGQTAWSTSYAYARRYGIMPHDDRIFVSKWERTAYWSQRKGKPHG